MLNKSWQRESILICASPQKFVKEVKAGAAEYFVAIQNICKLWLLLLREKT
jgi:hypothetical protein